MRRLHAQQRDFLSDIFKKLIFIAATAVVFGQFVPGQKPSWPVVLGGTILISLMIIIAVKLKKPD